MSHPVAPVAPSIPCAAHPPCIRVLTDCSQIRQGIASATKGTAFVVYEDVMDAKSACDKLNGFNFQNRYLVGKFALLVRHPLAHHAPANPPSPVLYHQPEKMVKAANDLAERQENLEKLKRQHGID